MLPTEVQRQRIAQYARTYIMRTAVNYGHANAEYRATARWMHTLNVLRNATLIAEGEGLAAEGRAVLEVAALFHDVDHYTVEMQYHGLRGAETAAHFLKKEGLAEEFVAAVAEAVRNHHQDFDDDAPIADQVAQIAAALSPVARMLVDAETLDKIGATNILQATMTLSTVNHTHIHEVARELTAGWPLQRARCWAETLITPTGQRTGAQRLAFYEQFLAQIDGEIVMADPFPLAALQTQETAKVG